MNLLEVLQNWNDRESIQSGVEQAGFNVHNVYQSEMKTSVAQRSYSDLFKYWNELAREWIACAGKVDSRRRIFPSNAGYRSKYLDKLAEERKSQNIPETAALHPCERLFNGSIESSGLGFVLTADSEALKHFDQDTDVSATLNRRSNVEDLSEYLNQHLSEHCFTKSGSQLKRKLDSGLTMTAGIEKSNAPQLIQLLVYLKVSKPGSIESLHFSDFSILVPGFRYNAIVLSDIGISYGLRAHACLIGEIARSFEKL